MRMLYSVTIGSNPTAELLSKTQSLATPRSIRRVFPPAIARAMALRSMDIPRLWTRSLAVPRGIKPSGASTPQGAPRLGPALLSHPASGVWVEDDFGGHAGLLAADGHEPSVGKRHLQPFGREPGDGALEFCRRT